MERLEGEIAVVVQTRVGDSLDVGGIKKGERLLLWLRYWMGIQGMLVHYPALS